MKGLELSERYYHEYGVRMIQTKFLPYQGRIAVGLVGDGSDCYGFDDEISQDHDWGPGFCLWLTREDHEKIGDVLQFEYEMLPLRFDGYQRVTSPFGGGRVGVLEIGAFYKRYIGMSQAPKTVMEWFYLPETYLAICTNGKVFDDPLGEFTRIREHLLAFYPEDVRLSKMAERCISCAQAGQYNYMRSVRRKEYFAAQYAETKFCADSISLVFLLNRRYAPFYKWRHRGVRDLPILGQFLYRTIGDMVAAGDYNQKYRIIEEISAAVINELRREGLSESSSDFLLDHGRRIREKIQDISIREKFG